MRAEYPIRSAARSAAGTPFLRRIACALLLGLATLGTPGEAVADPLGPHTYLQFGSSAHVLTGSAGSEIAPGIGFHLMHGVQFSRIGAYVDIRRAFHLSTADAPPFDTGVQHARLGLGLRTDVVAGPGRFLLGLEYSRFSFLTNPRTDAVRRRGTLHGAGSHLAYRLEVALPLFAELATGLAVPFGSDSGGAHLHMGLSLGLAGSLR